MAEFTQTSFRGNILGTLYDPFRNISVAKKMVWSGPTDAEVTDFLINGMDFGFIKLYTSYLEQHNQPVSPVGAIVYAKMFIQISGWAKYSINNRTFVDKSNLPCWWMTRHENRSHPKNVSTEYVESCIKRGLINWLDYPFRYINPQMTKTQWLQDSRFTRWVGAVGVPGSNFVYLP